MSHGYSLEYVVSKVKVYSLVTPTTVSHILQKSGHGILKAIKAELSGDYGKAVKTIGK